MFLGIAFFFIMFLLLIGYPAYHFSKKYAEIIDQMKDPWD